jgi:hypothetical protein
MCQIRMIHHYHCDCMEKYLFVKCDVALARPGQEYCLPASGNLIDLPRQIDMDDEDLDSYCRKCWKLTPPGASDEEDNPHLYQNNDGDGDADDDVEGEGSDDGRETRLDDPGEAHQGQNEHREGIAGKREVEDGDEAEYEGDDEGKGEKKKGDKGKGRAE